ncbi:MAG: MaoC family dehydratase N-terminal domain-containing protein [Dehalococcoidia bacterium]|jgi:acyl dehydratase
MATDTLITSDLMKLIGAQQDVSINKVEEGSIIRYAKAIGDPNPMFNDPEYAKNSRYGRIICPPGFFGWAMKCDDLPALAVAEKLFAAGAPRGVLDGGVDYEFFVPVGAGDVLTSIITITDIVERETKMGKTMVTAMVTKYINQNGDVVCLATQKFMNFRV